MEKMMVRVRPWYTKEDTDKIIEWATNQAKGNEIISVIIRENVYREDFVQVQYKTQTERQARFGYYDVHTVTKVLWKLPKKYQPHTIIAGMAQ